MTEISDELVHQFKDTFNLFDKDNDGFISVEELEDVMKSLGQSPTKDELKDMVNDVDTDGDGRIDFPEFLTMMSRKVHELDLNKEMEEAFKVFDKDGDGFITPAELKSVLHSLGDKLTNNEITMMMKEADLNGDGKINFHEFVQMMKSQ